MSRWKLLWLGARTVGLEPGAWVTAAHVSPAVHANCSSSCTTTRDSGGNCISATCNNKLPGQPARNCFVQAVRASTPTRAHESSERCPPDSSIITTLLHLNVLCPHEVAAVSG